MKPPCAWDDCSQLSHSRGYCGRHYNWAIRDGIIKRRREMPYWVVDPATGCWLWNRKIRKDGYGIKSTGKHTAIRAHRWVYEDLVGPIPEGLELDHLCNNPPCVNPDHLEPVTHEENMRRQWERRGAA